jgi:FkbM family methyltransferase
MKLAAFRARLATSGQIRLSRGMRRWSERVESAGRVRTRRDAENMDLLLAFALAEDSNCVDIGAHQGDFLQHCVRVAPRGAHVAFEPLPEFASALKARFPDVDVHRAAVGAEAGEHSFVHVPDMPGFSGLRKRSYPAPQETREIAVAVERLDDALPDGYVPALIKIDVEGAERDVILGGLETIRTHRPMVVFEHGRGAAEFYDTRPGDIFDLLSGEAGLRIFDLDGHGPYDRPRFEQAFDESSYFNFVAHR